MASTKIKKVESHEGTILVRSTKLYAGKPVEGTQTEEIEKIEVRPFVTSVVYVGSKMRFTKNLGDFNGFQVEVMMTHPCYVEESGRMYEDVKTFVIQKLEDHPMVKKYSGDDDGEEET